MFFRTRDRLRFLLFVGAIAAPILLAAAWVVSSMEASSFFDHDAYKDRTKIEYTINPVKK